MNPAIAFPLAGLIVLAIDAGATIAYLWIRDRIDAR